MEFFTPRCQFRQLFIGHIFTRSVLQQKFKISVDVQPMCFGLQIARSCSLDISETSRIKDMLGLLSLYFDKPLILINRQLDKQTKQMVCGYALGHYLEHQLLMDLHTLNKFLTIKDKHIRLYEHNAFTSHLMLDSDEVYQMTKRSLDAAQIAAAKGIHLNLVLVKLLELHHLGYDLRHYHAQHHAFIKKLNLPAHFQFDVAAG